MSALLTPNQVAERLHVSVGTLANWRSYNQGPPFVRVGGIRYPAEELERWIAKQPVKNRQNGEK